MSVYEIANTLILERASRDEFHMQLFAMLADYFWPNDNCEHCASHRMRDIREFIRLTAIPTSVVDEIRQAAYMAFV